MKPIFVRYYVKDDVRRLNDHTEMCNRLHASDILDVPDDKVGDEEYIKGIIADMHELFKEYIIIKYIRLWQ